MILFKRHFFQKSSEKSPADCVRPNPPPTPFYKPADKPRIIALLSDSGVCMILKEKRKMAASNVGQSRADTRNNRKRNANRFENLVETDTEVHEISVHAQVEKAISDALKNAKASDPTKGAKSKSSARHRPHYRPGDLCHIQGTAKPIIVKFVRRDMKTALMKNKSGLCLQLCMIENVYVSIMFNKIQFNNSILTNDILPALNLRRSLQNNG